MKTFFNPKYKKLIQTVLFTLVLVFISVSVTSNTALAQLTSQASGQYTVLAPLPCIQGGGVSCPGGNLALQSQVSFQTYIQYILNLAIALSAVIAVFQIVWGGFQYITSTIPGVKSDGAKKIKNAVFGLILVLASYLILRTIDPRLVQIPDTLVPQLTLNTNITTDATQNFLDQLQSAANNQSTDYQNAKTDQTNAQNQAATIQSQLNSVNQELQSYYSGDTDMTQDKVDLLAAERQNLVNQLNYQNNAQVVAGATQGMVASLQTSTQSAIADPSDNSTNTTSSVQGRIDQINTLYNNAVATMDQNANPPDPTQKQALDNQYNYALAELTVDKFETQQDIGSTNEATINGYINKITDPNLKAQATAYLQANQQKMIQAAQTSNDNAYASSPIY